MSNTTAHWIIGGGVAGLASAALLIREGGIPGEQIHILEAGSIPGGSLDGAGNPDQGYLIRGGRMFETHFGCTYDLLAGIPSLTHPGRSVTEDIRAFTEGIVTSSRCRLVVDRKRREAPALELDLADRVALGRLLLTSETRLGASTIEERMPAHFFTTAFWCMWSTMFAFQRWHSACEFRRYLRRFMHLMPGFSRLEGIWRTPLNQYDSIIRPLVTWLESRGVDIRTGTCVTDIGFGPEGQPRAGAKTAAAAPARVTAIGWQADGHSGQIALRGADRAIITLGSMTAATRTGTHTAPPPAAPPTGSVAALGNAWSLWQRIAAGRPAFGRPEAFCGDPTRSSWTSFTVTLRDPAFFDFMERFTGNAAGTGGLVTFRHSRWMLSIVLARQPHFAGQPDDVTVFWGYALASDQPGDCVPRPITECSGADILAELAWHLPLDPPAQAALAGANCIPCAMPWITSEFMPRQPGDRPAVMPEGAQNYAFVGQFCELPDDTVFTVEYSVRSAQHAVCGLLGRTAPLTPLYHGHRHPGVVLRALRALH